MQIATWNVNSLPVRLPQVLDWLQANPEVNVLGVQETKVADEKFPVSTLTEAGLYVQFFGQKTYNGVALISRTPMCDVRHNITNMDCDMARLISASTEYNNQELRIVCAYVPNGQAPESDKFIYKMRWLDALRAQLQEELQKTPNLIVMGDFNITFDDSDVWDPEGLRETIHCTAKEREQLKRLIDLGLVDSLRLFPQPEKAYTWWDYRSMSFRRKRGMRIDHILISNSLQNAAQSCYIDVNPRRNERPSDHTPVVLSLK